MEPWMTEGACNATGMTAIFFSESPRAEARAKATCANCRVTEQCLAYAIDRQEQGVWGGLNERERYSRLQAGTPTESLLVFELVTYTTRARSTGSTCSAGRTKNNQWGAICETHGCSATTLNRTAAEYAVSRPEEWCPDCGVAFLEKVG